MQLPELIGCHRGRHYCLPHAMLLLEAERSQWSTTGFSSLAVVKIKCGRGLKSFCFETSNTKRNLTWDAEQVSLAVGVYHRINYSKNPQIRTRNLRHQPGLVLY